MPPRRRAPTFTSWARELQNAGSSGRLEPSALAEILRTADGRLDEMWGFLRDVDITSAENLKGFEAFLEAVYRLIIPSVPTGPSARETVVDAANRTLIEIDETKKASRALRRVSEASRVLRRAVESAAINLGTDAIPFSRLVGADEDELTIRQNAVITGISSLRAQISVTAELFKKEAERNSGTGPRASSSTNKPRQRRHHQPWRIAG